MIFSRSKPTPRIHDKSRRVGIDLSSSRIRAVVGGQNTDRAIVLDSPQIELPLAVNLDRKPVEVGNVGYRLIRKSPHHVCSNFLPHINEPKTWKCGRTSLTADAALGAAFSKIANNVCSEAEAIGLAIPTYLTPPQAVAIAAAATSNKLPITGTVSSALAIVADRAEIIWRGEPLPERDDEQNASIVPIRTQMEGPGSAVIVDCDDHAVTASVIWVERNDVRLLNSASWTKLSARVWKDRLIDAISDRCVRLCRRDPRDSADAEQSLLEQLDMALASQSGNRPMAFHLRAAHWYQDLVLQSHDFDAVCAVIVNHAITGLTELIYSSGVPAPPRAIWMTAAASQIPGLSAAIYENSAENTSVASLPADAIAAAAARLAPRWLSGELPRTHLDSVIPITSEARAISSRESVLAKRG